MGNWALGIGDVEWGIGNREQAIGNGEQKLIWRLKPLLNKQNPSPRVIKSVAILS